MRCIINLTITEKKINLKSSLDNISYISKNKLLYNLKKILVLI